MTSSENASIPAGEQSAAAGSSSTNDSVLAAQRKEKGARFAQSRDAGIAEIHSQWWSYPPVTAADNEIIELSFVDATGNSERWEMELVPCSLSEPFTHAAQRFRVAANKRYRHPFLPSRHFDLLLESDQRSDFDSLSSRTIADVLGDTREVRYVRNDNGQAQREEQEKSPSKLFPPWERAHLLPSWCETPDLWFEPTPPPGFSASKAQGKQYYAKIPTLHIPFACIRSAAFQPQHVARSLYLPVQDNPITGQTSAFLFDREKDLVPFANRIPTSTITVEAARSLLGRFVQSSTEPLRDDAPPTAKKQKKTMGNKYQAQTVAIAWGLTVDQDGKPDWLHCATLRGNWQFDVVLDLTGRLNRPFGYPGVKHANCAWLGAVVLDADRRALEENERAEQKERPPQDADQFSEWSQKTRRWIRNLNAENADKLIEVGQNGTFLAGDIELAKGDSDEFELTISGAKPGTWRMLVSEPLLAQLAWVRDGTVDYDALLQEHGETPRPVNVNDSLEELGTFTVDSGHASLFSQSAFDSLTSGNDREAKIETLIDAAMDGRGDEVYVPGGLVVNGDDGTYVLEGTRDDGGQIVFIKLRPSEAE
ncbi:unnamed protein product [Peniophora sp. CBMAI 1063]|nr:unnamed protein product [Peniophora sp. CBMAI 1063]